MTTAHRPRATTAHAGAAHPATGVPHPVLIVTDAPAAGSDPRGPVTHAAGAAAGPAGPVVDPRGPVTDPLGPVTDAGSPGPRRRSGLTVLLGSAFSAQIGAATGSLAFPTIGVVGVVAVRQFVSAVTLLAIARPPIRQFTWRQWWPTLLLGVVFGVMNLGLYLAIDRVGLGLAVTLEFLGPLGVALATSRNRITAACAALAIVGVVLLTHPEATTDYLGVAFGLLAAACWAAYILLNREVGRRLPGVQGSAVAAGLSALLFVPVAIVVFLHHPPTWAALGFALTAGLLSSVVPQIADLTTLRKVPAHLFSILMSSHPVFAAAVGTVALHQVLHWSQWAGIAAIVAANTWTVLAGRRHPTPDRLGTDTPSA